MNLTEPREAIDDSDDDNDDDEGVKNICVKLTTREPTRDHEVYLDDYL